MFKTASKIRIYLRMEGNIIFQGRDATKKSILFLLWLGSRTSCIEPPACVIQIPKWAKCRWTGQVRLHRPFYQMVLD